MAAVSILAGAYSAVFIYGGSDPSEGGRFYGFMFAAVCSLPAGFLLGLAVVQPRKKPSPHDVEVDWMQRAKAGAFWDLTWVLAAIAVVLAAAPDAADVKALPIIVGLLAFLYADMLCRRFVLRHRARG